MINKCHIIYLILYILWVAIERLKIDYLNTKGGGKANKVSTDTESSTGSC